MTSSRPREASPRPAAQTESPSLLALDRWQALAPQLAGATGEERASLLDAQGVDEALWERSDAHWSLELGRQVAAGAWESAERYGRQCAAHCAARRARKGGEARGARDEGAAGAAREPCVDETSAMVLPPLGPALPFVPGGAAAAPAVPAAPEPRRLDLMGETSELRLAGAQVAAVPFVSLAELDTSVERYAELCARQGNDVHPSTAGSAAARGELAALHHRWEQRFAAEPALRERWTRLVRLCRGALAAGPEGSR